MFRTGATQEIIEMIRFGIDEVIPLCWLGCFDAEDLGAVLCGTKDRISVTDWIDNAAVTEETKPEDYKLVGWFWQIVRILSLEAQYKLFHFWTGSDVLPVGGIGGVPEFVVDIKVNRDSVIQLPFARTCFNLIEIPPYATKQILFDRLTKAIYNFQGFSKA